VQVVPMQPRPSPAVTAAPHLPSSSSMKFWACRGRGRQARASTAWQGNAMHLCITLFLATMTSQAFRFQFCVSST
jgi:hypothetical protein